MKTILKRVIFSSFLLITNSLFGQQLPAYMTQIKAAIQAGNATELSRYFDSQVELTILDNENGYSKVQALEVVKNFFNKHPVTTFRIMHHSTTGGNAEYAIGTLQTTRGSFRTYILLKNVDKRMLIQQLKFTED